MKGIVYMENKLRKRAKHSREAEREEAWLALEQAKLTQTTGQLQAEQKYDNKKLTGEQADANEAISAAEQQQAYLSAENSL